MLFQSRAYVTIEPIPDGGEEGEELLLLLGQLKYRLPSHLVLKVDATKLIVGL